MFSSNKHRLTVIPAEIDPYNPKRDEELQNTNKVLLFLKKENRSFGFTVESSKYCDVSYEHLITQVEPNGPAQRVGVTPNWTLLKINGQLCEKLKHKEVVNVIKRTGENSALLFSKNRLHPKMSVSTPDNLNRLSVDTRSLRLNTVGL